MNRMIFTTVMAALWMLGVPNVHWGMIPWGLVADFTAEGLSNFLEERRASKS